MRYHHFWGRSVPRMCVRVAKHGFYAAAIEDDESDDMVSRAFAVIKDLECAVLRCAAGPKTRVATDSILSQIHCESFHETAENARSALTCDATARQGELAVLALKAELPCASLLLAQWASRGKRTGNELIRSHSHSHRAVHNNDNDVEHATTKSVTTSDDDDGGGDEWSVTELD